ERLSELTPLARVPDRALDRGARDPDRLRGDADASAIETRERDAEPAADLAEHRVGADARILEDERARIGCEQAHLVIRRTEAHARSVHRKDERGDAGGWSALLGRADAH